MFKKALIVGTSRGLGRAVTQLTPEYFAETKSLTTVSRKAQIFSFRQTVEIKKLSLDMTREEDVLDLGTEIDNEKFDLIIYAAGGGPHGEFARKEWKDHRWAMELGLLTPIELVYLWLKTRDRDTPGRFVVVGSAIAESKADPLAASYAAAKHGLKGFVSSLQFELAENKNKVWLYSPGFMDTEMLPANAVVRHNGEKLASAESAARGLLEWLKKEDSPWHLSATRQKFE